jgi:hypothetical protein
VPTAPDRYQHLTLASEINRRDDVGDIHAPSNEPGMAIDHSVVDLAGTLIVSVRGLNELTAKRRLKTLK